MKVDPRHCMFCDGALDWDQNGLTWSIALSAYDPDYAAHDLCAVGARANERDLTLHRLYCHLGDCEWKPKGFPWTPRKVAIQVFAPEPKPPNVGEGGWSDLEDPRAGEFEGTEWEPKS